MRVTMRAWVVAGALVLVGCGGRTLPSDEAPGLPIAWLSYADDGTLIAASRWRVVRLDPQLNEIDRTIPPYPFQGDRQGLTFFGVSRDGRVAAYGWQEDDPKARTIDPGAIVFEVPSGNLLHLDPRPQANFQGLSLSPDGRTMAVVDSPKLQVASVADGQVLWEGTMAGYSLPLFTPDSGSLLVAPDLATLEVVRASDGAPLSTLAPLGDYATWVTAVSADGSTAAASFALDPRGTAVTRWRLDGAALGTVMFPEDIGGPVALALSPDGQWIAASVVPGGPQNNALVVWDGDRLLYRHDGETVWAVAFSPDGQTLAVANNKLGIRLLRASDGAVLAQHKILVDDLGDPAGR